MSVGTLNVFALDATPEAGYGVAAASPDKAWPFRGNRPKINIAALSDDASLVGVYEEGRDSIVGKKWMEASFEYDMRLDALGFWLKALLGTDTVTGTNPYNHTINLKQGDADSFTAYWKDANTTASKLEQFTGVKVQKMTIKGTAGGKFTVSVDLKGSGVHAEVTATAPAFNKDIPLPFALVSAFTVNGTDYKSKLLDFELVLENVFDDASEFAAGSTTLPQLERTSFKVSGKFSLKYDENALTGLMADIESQTGRAIVLTITSGANSATFNIYKAVMSDTAVDGGRGKLKKPISFVGLYDDTASKSVQAVVVNTTASYA